MSKHITDHSRSDTDGALLKSFAKVARQSGKTGPHTTTSMLQRRAKTTEGSRRLMQEFLRISRGGGV